MQAAPKRISQSPTASAVVIIAPIDGHAGARSGVSRGRALK
jgi:hypothetical protein